MKKMAGNKKVLVAGFLNVWATDHCINRDRESTLDCLSSLFVSTRPFWLLALLLSSQTHDFAHNY